MKFGAFLIFSLLFTSYCVDSKPIQPKDDEYQSALEQLNAAREFLESTKTKLENIEVYAAIDEKRGAEYIVGILLEAIRLGPSKVIEIEEELSEIVQLIDQASEVQASGDDLKNVFQKVKKAEDVVNQTKDQQQATVLQHIKYMVDIVNEIRANVEANPDSLLEQLKLTEELIEKLHAVPKYFTSSIKKNYLDIIEQLWNVDLAVDSVKAAYPSETEQLKRILREMEGKLRKETKQLTMQIVLTKTMPDDSIHLTPEGSNDTKTDDDDLNEIRERMLHLGELLEGANLSFLESIDEVVEQIKANFPEEYQQLQTLVDEVKVKISGLKVGVKTVVDKIKLDASEGVKMDHLYTEMFARALKNKLDVLTRNAEKITQIFDSVLSELPDGNQLKTTIEAFKQEMGDMGQFGEFVRECFKTFYIFLLGEDEIDVLMNLMNMLSNAFSPFNK